MISLDDICKAIIHWPQAFSECHTIPGAVAYCQQDNPLSHDGNHAHILRNDEFAPVLVDAVTWMYQDWGITPRVYSAGPGRDQEDIKSLLVQSGYSIVNPEKATVIMTRPESRAIAGTAELQVRKITASSPELAALYADEPWDAGCLNNSFSRKGLKLYGGYAGKKLVCAVSISESKGLFYIDHVKTLAAEQGKGYAQALLNQVLNDTKASAPDRQFLLSSAPTAIHIYGKLGFKTLEERNPFWQAVMDGKAPQGKGKSTRNGPPTGQTSSKDRASGVRSSERNRSEGANRPGSRPRPRKA